MTIAIWCGAQRAGSLQPRSGDRSRGISLRCTGVVDDLDGDRSKPRQPLVVEVRATVIEVPHLWVTWRTTGAEEVALRFRTGLIRAARQKQETRSRQQASRR